MNHKLSFLPCRKDRRSLLASAAIVCLAAVRAAGADWSLLDPAQADSAAFGQPQAVSPQPLSNAPGTPYTFNNPLVETIILSYSANSAQPAPISGSNILNVTSAVAGDIVLLSDPAGTNDPSNWVAVFRFLNLDDPTGVQGLPASEVAGFDTSNAGSAGFTGFQLFPNTVYLADIENPPGHVATATEFGDGSNGLLAGQTAIFIYTINVPEPSTWAVVLIGIVGLAVGARRRTTANG